MSASRCDCHVEDFGALNADYRVDGDVALYINEKTLGNEHHMYVCPKPWKKNGSNWLCSELNPDQRVSHIACGEQAINCIRGMDVDKHVPRDPDVSVSKREHLVQTKTEMLYCGEEWTDREADLVCENGGLSFSAGPSFPAPER